MFAIINTKIGKLVMRSAGVCGVIFAMLSSAQIASAEATYETFNITGDETFPLSINALGTVVGLFYARKGGDTSSFIRASNGSTVTFSISGSFSTIATGINDAGQIVGNSSSKNEGSSGFLRQPDGTTIAISVPNGDSTSIESINSEGDLVGWYDVDGVDHGFLRKANGKFVYFDVPGEVSTNPDDINDKGETTGSYVQDGATHGFVRDADSDPSIFDAPDADGGTYPSAINNEGELVGFYAKSDGTYHAFLRAADGSFTEFDVPGMISTRAQDINNKGVITGNCGDPSATHGFVRTPDGAITVFDLPIKKPFYAFGRVINKSGEIAGSFLKGKGRRAIIYGFVRKP